MKPGWKTSEFWLRLLGKSLGAGLAVVGMLNETPTTQAISVIMGGALALLSQWGYSKERTALKAQGMDASARALSLKVEPFRPEPPQP